MRFLTLMGSGVGVGTANESIVFATTGRLRKRGVIGQGIPSAYPVSMIQASNGTLLIATGLGPMYRMRRNEGVLSQADRKSVV